jgi:histidine triad (HIT) family protein
VVADGCAFCAIVAGEAPAKVVLKWHDALAIVPLNPVTEGHVIVLPKDHVQDALADPFVTATVVQRAAELAHRPANISTSAGGAATQTGFHLPPVLVDTLPTRRPRGVLGDRADRPRAVLDARSPHVDRATARPMQALRRALCVPVSHPGGRP